MLILYLLKWLCAWILSWFCSILILSAKFGFIFALRPFINCFMRLYSFAIKSTSYTFDWGDLCFNCGRLGWELCLHSCILTFSRSFSMTLGLWPVLVIDLLSWVCWGDNRFFGEVFVSSTCISDRNRLCGVSNTVSMCSVLIVTFFWAACGFLIVRYSSG